MAKHSASPVVINATNRTLVRVVLIFIAALVLIRFISLLSDVITLVAISFFLALALNPAVTWISGRLHIRNRITATAIAYLAVISILAVLGMTIVPTLVNETSRFVDQIPQSAKNLRTSDTAIADFVRNHGLNDQAESLATNVRGRMDGLGGPAASVATSVGSAIFTILAVFIMTFLMIAEGRYWKRMFWQYYPAKNKQRHQTTASKMYRIITGYVNGQLLLATIAAVAAFIVLTIASNLLNVTVNTVGLAGVVGIIGLIPMIGNTIASVVVVLICLFSSFPLAIIMAAFFLLYQQIENVTLQPIIQAKFNELTPLLVFVAALIGVGLGGIIGAFVAIPTAGIVKLIFNEYLIDLIRGYNHAGR